MNDLTLHFISLTELADFTKLISCGYFLNTVNLTITGNIPRKYADLAIQTYHANIIATTSERYSWMVSGDQLN
jgi:hypothetical protein